MSCNGFLNLWMHLICILDIPVILVGISMVPTNVPGDTASLNVARMFGIDRKWVSSVRTSSTVLVWMWPCKKRRNQSDPSAKNTSSWLLPLKKHTVLESQNICISVPEMMWTFHCYFDKLYSHARQRSVWDDKRRQHREQLIPDPNRSTRGLTPA